MDSNLILKVLKEHGIDCSLENGQVISINSVGCMHPDGSFTTALEEENHTGWSKTDLYFWLGY